MDKRFFLALVLTAVVVIATPWLFGTRNARTKADRDTAAVQRVDASKVPNGDSTVASRPVETTPASTIGSRDSSTRIQPVATGIVETTTVSLPLVDYQFTSSGARLLSADLKSYRALNGSKRSVKLESQAGQLVGFDLFLPGDTINLDRVVFIADRGTGQGNGEPLSYRGSINGLEVLIHYAFSPDSYLVRITGEVHGAPQSGAFVGVRMPSDLRSAEADSTDDQQHLAYAIKTQRDNAQGIPFSKLDPGEQRLVSGPITWIAAKNKYFIVGALVLANEAPFAEAKVIGGARTGRRATHASGIAIQPLRNNAFGFELYTGPQEWRRLLALGRGFENSNPYGGFLQGVVQPFATIVMRILLWMRATLNLGYGWVLVIFGVAVRLLLWPLNQKAMRTSMKMSRLQPELAEIQKRHKADPSRMQSEIMRVYRDHGMSPFSSLSGCLPMLLPMPILFALFFVFQNTIEFRGVPFLWLADISLKDPYYIVPVVMGISMFVLSIIGMRNSPPNPQAKMMSYVLPVMMTVFFLNLASGLNLYYAVQNLTAIPQQWLISNERAKNSVSPATAKA
jgi:YidC/Oxa1 family membrane protein insertase